MFYHFRQNNSGGCFYYDDTRGIGVNVIIEAYDWIHANDRAEDGLGLYFRGCDEGNDCPCCGDRWRPCDEYDGDEVPSVDGVPIEKAKTYANWGYDKSGFVHYLDGRVVPFTLAIKGMA